MKDCKLYCGDAIEIVRTLPDESVQCVVTSPPYYGLRDYGTAKWNGGDANCDHRYRDYKRPITSTLVGTSNSEGFALYNYQHICKKCGAIRIDDQIGLEQTPEAYVGKLVEVFREIRRVLRKDGTVWLNLGDSYAGSGIHAEHHANPGISQSPKRGCTHGVPVTKGLKPKDLMGIPWRVAFALQANGWWLRQDIIWSKPNPMPESVRDRCTKAHEYVFLLTKSQKYYYDYMAILEPAKFDGRKDTKCKGSPKYKDSGQTCARSGGERWPNKIVGRTERKMAGTGYCGDGNGLHGHSGYFDKNGNPLFYQFEDGVPARNKRSVWTIATKPYKGAHFATFPPDLILPCVLAGSKPGDIVLDPFNGSGTTGLVALENRRCYIGIDLNEKYIEITTKRLENIQVKMF